MRRTRWKASAAKPLTCKKVEYRVRNIIDQHANDGGVEPQTIRDLQAAIRRLTEQMNNLREGLAALGTDVDVVDSAAAAMSIDLDAA